MKALITHYVVLWCLFVELIDRREGVLAENDKGREKDKDSEEGEGRGWIS